MLAVLFCIVVQIIISIINAVISIIICFSNKGEGWKLRLSGESLIRLYYNAYPHTSHFLQCGMLDMVEKCSMNLKKKCVQTVQTWMRCSNLSLQCLSKNLFTCYRGSAVAQW